MVVTYGFSQLYWALPRLEHKNIGSPDLIRSGWTDLRAFTIADLFEAGFKVLLLGQYLEPSSEAWAVSSRVFSPDAAGRLRSQNGEAADG